VTSRIAFGTKLEAFPEGIARAFCGGVLDAVADCTIGCLHVGALPVGAWRGLKFLVVLVTVLVGHSLVGLAIPFVEEVARQFALVNEHLDVPFGCQVRMLLPALLSIMFFAPQCLHAV
jgi:hypothetical protein